MTFMRTVHDQLSFAIGGALTLVRAAIVREEGQGTTEYGLVIGLLVISLAASVGLLGTAVGDFMGRVAGDVGLFFP
jgi:hypothetical protein